MKLSKNLDWEKKIDSAALKIPSGCSLRDPINRSAIHIGRERYDKHTKNQGNTGNSQAP